MKDLTAEQVIETLEALDGRAVLLDWKKDKDGDWVRRRYESIFLPNVRVIKKDGMWRVFSKLLDIYGEPYYATPELAMSAVDAILSQTPGVLAAGISPVPSKETEA